MSLGGGKPIGPWEERAFNDAYNAGVLPVAAAGNAGNAALSYPAYFFHPVAYAHRAGGIARRGKNHDRA